VGEKKRKKKGKGKALGMAVCIRSSVTSTEDKGGGGDGKKKKKKKKKGERTARCMSEPENRRWAWWKGRKVFKKRRGGGIAGLFAHETAPEKATGEISEGRTADKEGKKKARPFKPL